MVARLPIISTPLFPPPLLYLVALSHDDGKVLVDWDVEDDTLVIHWVETNGASAPQLEPEQDIKGGGSGSRLIEGVIRGLRGTVETRFEPSGLRATISVPASARTIA